MSNEKTALIPLKTFTTPLAGITMSGYDRESLVEGQRVKIKREPTNQYDPNAIQVLDLEDKRIAYIPKRVAALLSPRLESKPAYRAKLVLVPSGDLDVWGVEISLFRREAA